MNEYVLFHGTDSENIDAILKDGFKSNPNPQDWLGHGVYFFIDGVSSPLESALEWAKNKYFPSGASSVSVVQAHLKVEQERTLDLTSTDGLKRYNQYREVLVECEKESLLRRRDLKIKKRKDFRIDDQIVMNMVIARLEIDLVIANLYIKNSIQRGLELESCLPNSTVACVINTQVLNHSKTVEVMRCRESERVRRK